MNTATKTPAESTVETPSPPQFIKIEKSILENLVRRTDVRFTNGYPKLDSVICLPENEYEGFLQIQEQYANLVHNLLASGISSEKVWNLAKSTTKTTSRPPPGISDAPLSSTTLISPRETNLLRSHHAGTSDTKYNKVDPPCPTNTDSRREWRITSSKSASIIGPKKSDHGHSGNTYPLQPKRSIILEGLPASATCWDVTSAVRGGALVEFTMVAAKRMAIVSFVSHDNAACFFEHSKKRGLYVNNIEVSLKWADKQFIVSPFISNKAEFGATRNLVVRACRSHIKESRIRQDLEHINRLVIIKIEFIDSDCHIKTNSIQLALYAKTCMMSRSEYHGFLIGWDADECDQPLTTPREDTIPESWRSLFNNGNTASTKGPASKIHNRFSSLEVEGNEHHDTS
ncbi:uncharacterized protein GGS22DRAFT_170930 [Annulohypoxylon maeteangense]|uniref:uncharacterized protein n=1 Tax=Annulohypoxylon maeteangense TaxID=1927788 RepID=UPI002008307A|nr:uncharacterized protein GGS22DRAFT_170930 [Annulohypoxylon maeteangense]KAI0881863.1 hypothetical protein GGS22DRAFT_170930 [Annulohypoxylon maeteangense]